MNDTINTEQQQQPATTPTPEASGDQGNEKLFTQEEVNRIVSDRLARAKRDTAADDREQSLKAREARMDCREYLADRQYPVDLLDVLDTSDVERFKENVEKLSRLFQNTAPKAGTVRVDLGGPLGGRVSNQQQSVADAFKPKI